MTTYSCDTHINQALDLFVAEEKNFPTLEKLTDSNETCSYCEQQAIYSIK